MTLRRLSVQNLRNLSLVDIELNPQLNVFYGANGSGKTSLLEAISILSLGRSFRSRKFKTLINRDQQAYTVFGVVQDTTGSELPVGVQRGRQAPALIKKNGAVCATAAELAETLPVRVMNGHSFSLLEGAPQVRREFLDWLVFHVEPEFYGVWKSYEKCLKQRNSLLRRDKIDPLQLSLWDSELAPLAQRLDHFRSATQARLNPVFSELISGFKGLESVSLKYSRGWDSAIEFTELLQDTRGRDSELGYTRQGPHRADLRISSDKALALDVLSRGQQKIVVSALMIAQGMVFSKVTSRTCVFLIDDLPAELDENFRQTLAGWLSDMNCQVCVTGVDRQTLLDSWKPYNPEKTVFHVKHGVVTQDKP